MSDRILLGKNDAGDQGFWVSKPGANVISLVGNSYLEGLGDWYAFQEELTGNGSAGDWEDSWPSSFPNRIKPYSTGLVEPAGKHTTNGTMLWSPHRTGGADYAGYFGIRTGARSGFHETAFIGSEYPIIEMKLRLVDPSNSDNPTSTNSNIYPDIVIDFTNKPIAGVGNFEKDNLVGNTINSWYLTPTGLYEFSSEDDYTKEISSNTFDYTDYPDYRNDGNCYTIFTDSEYRVLQWDMSDQDTWMDPYKYTTRYDTDGNPHPYSGQYRINDLYVYINRNGHGGSGYQPIWEIDYIRVKKKGVPKDAGSYGSVRDSLIFSTEWYHSGLVHQSGTVTIGTQKANIDGTTSSNLFSDTVKETDTGIINFPRLPYIPLVLFQRYDPSGNTAYPGGEQEFSIGSTEWEDHTYPSTNLGGRNVSQVGYDMQLVGDSQVGAAGFYFSEYYSSGKRTSDWTHIPWESSSSSWYYYDGPSALHSQPPVDANLKRYGNYYTTESSGSETGYGGISYNMNMLPQGARATADSVGEGSRPPYIPDADPWNYGGPEQSTTTGSLEYHMLLGGNPDSDLAYNDEVGKTITTEELPWKTDIPSHDTGTFNSGYYESHRAGNNFANQISTFYEARTFAYARAGKDHFALTCRNAIGNDGMEPVLNLAPTLPEEGTANQGSAAYNSMKFMNDNGNWGMFHPAFTLYDTHDGNGRVKFSEGLKLSANTTTSANDMFLDKVGEAGAYKGMHTFGVRPRATFPPDAGSLPSQTYPQFKWNPSFSSHPLIFDGELARPTDDPPTLAAKDNTSSFGFPQFGMMDASKYLDNGQEYKNNHGKYEGSTGGFYPYRYHREEKSIGGSLALETEPLAHIEADVKPAFFWYEYDIKRLSSKGITHPYGAVPESNSAFTNINGTRGATGQVKNQTAYIGGARNIKTATDSDPTFNENDIHTPVYKYWVLRIPMSISTYTPED